MFLPQIVCSLLLNCFYNVADTICSIVTHKKMYMVFICFHSDNLITITFTNIINYLFYIIGDRAFKQRLTIFCYKNYMHFETVFTSVMTSISTIHNYSHALTFTNKYYIIYLVN